MVGNTECVGVSNARMLWEFRAREVHSEKALPTEGFMKCMV